MREIERQQRERLQQALSVLSLGEAQLLLLGLWVIGEENRVDPRLEYEYGVLLNALGAAAHGTLGHLLSTTGAIAGVPYVTEPLTPNAFTPRPDGEQP